MKFDPTLLTRVRRINRALEHHDSTLRAFRDSSSVLEGEAFTLMLNRVHRLQTESSAVNADRRALADALSRLGIDLEDSDAAVGRQLRRALGHHRTIRRPRAK